MSSRWLNVLILSCLACAFTTQARGEPLTREAAEQQLSQLDVQIKALQESLEAARGLHAREQAALKAVDLEIQENARRLQQLAQQQAVQQSELQRLQREREAYLDNLGQRREQIEAQLRSAYRLAGESRLKLILNQDDPAQLSRLLAYYEYLSRQQAGRVEELRTLLADLEALHRQVQAELEELRLTEQQYRVTEQQLASDRQQREQVTKQLSASISSDELKMAELAQNRADLETLLERLEDALADIPADLGDHLHPATQKGRLPMPVKGRVMHAFGQPRTTGLLWQGWLISAATGTEVRAIAYGRVAYADWLRGYGLMLIIDHGEGFMSLYGNNESLFFEVGDWVQPGAVISAVGLAANHEQGLYFELRHKGKTVDPASWLSRN